MLLGTVHMSETCPFLFEGSWRTEAGAKADVGSAPPLILGAFLRASEADGDGFGAVGPGAAAHHSHGGAGWGWPATIGEGVVGGGGPFPDSSAHSVKPVAVRGIAA